MQPNTTSSRWLALAIGVLTLGTALTHITLAFPDLIFILNGLGYLTLLAALYLPIPQLQPYRHYVRYAFIGYTVLTILLWVILGARTPIGYINKANELALLVLLIVEDMQTRR